MMPLNFQLTDMFSFFLVLARVIGVIVSAPFFSQKEIIPQVKIAFCLLLSFILMPMVQDKLPTIADSFLPFAIQFIIQMFIGFFMGILCRAIFMMLDFLGSIIAMQAGLANATLFNPVSGTQNMLPSVFIGLGGIMLLLAMDMHYYILAGFINSYEIFDLSNPNLLNDMDESLLQVMERLFRMGLQFAYPFILIGIIVNFSLGLINKVVPQVQVFQTIMSSQVGIGLMMLTITITGILWGFSEFYKTELKLFLRL